MPPLTLLFPVLLALLLPTATAAAYPSCVETCISTHHGESWCTGDETDRARTKCVCEGLDGAPMIECIQSCDPGDQWEFAGGLPQSCRERLFPEVREVNAARGEGLLGGFGYIYGAVMVAMGM
ncbi:hypothetical protein BDW62DRAFT_106313 [Aspergillus aurantiobrunneus]